MTWGFPHATQPSQKKTLCRHAFLDLQYCVNKLIFFKPCQLYTVSEKNRTGCFSLGFV